MSIACLHRVVAELSSILSRLDPDALSPSEAAKAVSVFVQGENLCATGKALCAARAARAGEHKRAGHVDPAAWLAERSGDTRGRARDALNTAAALSRFGGLDDAVRSGELSPTKARVIAEAASMDPSSESQLLELARRGSLAELRDGGEAVKAAARSELDDERRYEEIRRNRHLRTFTGRDGAFKGQLSLTPDAGAKVLAVLQPASDFFFDEARRDGRREHNDAYLADALVAVITGEWRGCETDGQEDERTGDDGAEGPHEGAGGLYETGHRPRESADGPHKAGRNDESEAAPAGGDPNRSSVPTGDQGDPGNPCDSGRPGDGGDDAARDWGEFSPHEAAGVGEPEVRLEVDDGRIPVEEASGAAAPDGAPECEPRVAERAGPAAPPAQPKQKAGAPRRRRRAGSEPPRATVICRVDLAALRRGFLYPGETCEIPGVGPVPLAVARDLFGDCFLKFVISDGVDVRCVIHYGRSIPAHMKTALQFRDRCCVVPGCGRTFGLEYDHIVEFARGGPTTVGNLARLCGPHHAMKTHRGYRIRGGPGHWEWVAPAGRDEGAEEVGGTAEHRPTTSGRADCQSTL
jgi:hypothetical protein